MLTEELFRRAKPRERDAVSSALQDLSPPAWYLTDARGHRLPLSSVGYVMWLGSVYELRVAARPDEVKIVSRPAFLKPHAEPKTIAKHGTDYACFTFKAERELPWWQAFRWPYEFRADDLEVRCGGVKGSAPMREWRCPVVARTPWTWGIIILLVVGALVGWLIDQALALGRASFDADTFQQMVERWRAMPTSPRLWAVPLALALANPVYAFATTLFHLRRRRALLRARLNARLALPTRGSGVVETE